MTPPGLLLGGRYQLDSRIAVGGMGEVWRATDLVLGRAVAVKLLRSGCAGSEQDHARFRAEARHAGSLSHPGIARVYDYREADPPHPAYLVMELVDGSSLDRLLDEGPVDPARTMGLIAQAAAALQAAHSAGLVHRDIKPGNLLVGPDGDVKITDFGIAYAAGSASVTSPGALIGTPAYLAPERAAGAPATPAADLYALGIVAYQCLTGGLPFDGEPLAVALAHLEQPVPPLPPDVPADVAALVAGLTAKDPRARPASAGEVAERAERLRDTLTGTAARPPRLPVLAWAAPATDNGTLAWELPNWRGGTAGIRQHGESNRRGLAALNAVGVLAVIAAVAVAGWIIPGGQGPGSVPPPRTQRPASPGIHRAHHAGAARRTGGGTGADAPGPADLSATSGQPPASTAAAKPTPSRALTRTPAPSAAPSSSGTPSSAGTPSSSGTPSPTVTPTQAGTPSPTATPTQAGTPPPTATPTQTGASAAPSVSVGPVSALAI